MWSDKKYINIVIYSLLFLMGLNFFYVGQFIIPIICLIIFVENKFKFFVKDIRIFILLCLFAISYAAFSFELGYYGLISFCIPMCYYIGSNIKNKSDFRYAIYSIALGMASHLIINMIYELVFQYDFDVMYMFTKSNHYEIWLGRKVNSTLTALNNVFFIGIMYYVLICEKNKLIKYISIVTYAVALFYSFALGRRTTPILIFISMFIGLIADLFIFRNKKIEKKKVLFVVGIFLFLVITVIVLLKNNTFGIYNKLLEIRLFQKLRTQGLSSGRLDILFEAIKIAPNHLWGGREILNEIGSFVHDLWSDVYDYAGIIPFVIMIIISIIVFKKFINLAFNKQIQNKTKVLIIPWFVCISLIMFIEPVMSGGTIFFFSVIIVLSIIDKAFL